MYRDISLYVLAPHETAPIEIPTHFLATHLKADYVLTHIVLTTEWPQQTGRTRYLSRNFN